MDVIDSTVHQPPLTQPGTHLAGVALADLTQFRQPAPSQRWPSTAPAPSGTENLLIESARPLLNLMVNIRQQYRPEQDSALYRQVAPCRDARAP